MKLATPAAVSRWPMLVFTEPMPHHCRSLAPANACASAETSIGSPISVPVPWHST